MTEETATPEETKPNDLLALPEAPVSVNFYGVTKNGWNCQFTLRDFDDAALLKRMGQFITRLEEFHVTPKPVGQQPSNGSAAAPQPISSTALPVAPPTGNPPPATAVQTATLTFDADLLVGSISSGQTYWKVKGGKFAKFGVTVWPEVLAEIGITAEGLDPRQEYDLRGYKAHYIEENGKPRKVTKLEK